MIQRGRCAFLHVLKKKATLGGGKKGRSMAQGRGRKKGRGKEAVACASRKKAKIWGKMKGRGSDRDRAKELSGKETREGVLGPGKRSQRI